MFRYVKFALIWIVLLAVCRIQGISSIEGSGHQLVEDSREYTFAYHENRDDLHWYGANKWAVRFNFREVYPTMSESQFEIRKAQIYFPNLGNNVLVELFEDQGGQPLAAAPLRAAEAIVTQNLMEIEFDEPLQVEIVWMIVTYQTNFYGPYISASIGGGSRSYYLNSNVTIPYYQSMQAGGYNCELNFGVIGEFVLSDVDLRLVSFDLEGDLIPDREVNPVYRIYNHSDQTITGARIELLVSTPLTPTDDFYLEINLPSLLPHEYTVIDASSAGFGQNPVRLPSYATQLRVRAVLSSFLDGIEPSGNNTIVKYKKVFTEEVEYHLAENFLRNANIDHISNLQDQADQPNLRPLYYFPVAGDTLYSMGASQRFNWYGYNSLPRSVIGGDNQIIGYQDTYTSDYLLLAEQMRQRKTFISESSCRFSIPEQGEMIGVDITLSNNRTRLYHTTQDLNLMTGSRFYIGLFKKHVLNSETRLVFDRWIAYRDTINSGLGYESSIQRQYSFSLSNTDFTTLHANYAVVYWLQHTATKEILFSEIAQFDSGTSVSDPVQTPPLLSVYPNPIRSRDHVKLNLSDSKDWADLSISIYNLRGQRIYSSMLQKQDFIDNEITLQDIEFGSSGIYIMKATSTDRQGRRSSISKKFSVIK